MLPAVISVQSPLTKVYHKVLMDLQRETFDFDSLINHIWFHDYLGNQQPQWIAARQEWHRLVCANEVQFEADRTVKATEASRLLPLVCPKTKAAQGDMASLLNHWSPETAKARYFERLHDMALAKTRLDDAVVQLNHIRAKYPELDLFFPFKFDPELAPVARKIESMFH
jgi:hypothetical protein